jgi:hypothetical protein
MSRRRATSPVGGHGWAAIGDEAPRLGSHRPVFLLLRTHVAPGGGLSGDLGWI